ncbi:hypothetical protein [Glacieibacterium sp.]|uniref:hypothetical protein n=1 Tax=Glacieibacterium sp. TaxID=2860237 RepID=UPI003AFF63B7
MPRRRACSSAPTSGCELTPFTRFVGIDWTGAKGERHRAIAVAEALVGDGPPRLLAPDRPWSRAEVAALIAGYRDAGERVLVGIDMCFGLPFADAGGYFPGGPSPADARTLWREVDAVCAADPHHGIATYVDHRRDHFWLGAGDGPRRDRARLRVAERLDQSRGNVPSSVFVLLGAAQCGKASLSGMRVLAGLDGVPAWPMDPLPADGPVLVEIYCRLFAQMGGARGKLRSRQVLDAALVALGSAPCGDTIPETFDDHIGDALVSAAGLRAVAADPSYWSPGDLTPQIAATEGWTFGLR